MFVARLRLFGAPVDGAIGVEKVHGVETEDRQLFGDDFNVEPPSALKSMSLLFGNKSLPNGGEFFRPGIWSLEENVVWHHIIVPKCRYDRYLQVFRRVFVVPENLNKFVHQHLVQPNNLISSSGDLIIRVVPGRIPSPDYEINIVFQIIMYPLKRSVDEGEGRIAIGIFGAVETGIAFAPVTCLVL